MTILSVQAVSKTYKNIEAVHKLSLTVNNTEKIAICGSTGSGKTTFLKMMAGLVQPDEGEIYFYNQKLKGPEEKLLPGHPEIAYLSQHFELRNNYTVEELLDVFNKQPKEAANKIYAVCLIEHLLQRKTNEVSGGEKQRIALAIALSKNPKLLLLDEPFSNLDLIHKQQIKQVIENISNTFQLTIVLVTHDPSDVFNWANQLIIMKEGNFIQKDSPKQVYFKPANAYVAKLTGDCNVLPADAASRVIKNLKLKKNQQVIIRPEKILIEPASNIFQKDYVERIDFLGSYFLLEINVNNVVLIVKSFDSNYAVGQRVFLRIDEQSITIINLEEVVIN